MTGTTATIDIQLTDSPVQWSKIDPYPEPSGAECIFLGRTRVENHPKHGQLTRLSYHAYAPMAETLLQELATQAITQFSCHFVRIHHATGEVPPGMASVFIQVACGHRDRAFEACRFLIDQIKTTVPIWKREVWADGTTWSQGTPVSTGAQEENNER